ncbi:MAG: hypothetical protein ACJZ1Y_01765 [Candidatus Neomarinimicrobiota bacterium]
MFVVDSMKYFLFIYIISLTCLFSQENNLSSPKKISNRIQVTVSGNHPDAINDKPTIIYDNTKNIDLRSNNRPIKNTIPPSDTEEELFLPNEVIPSLSIEEPKLGDHPETEPINEEPSKLISDEYVSTFNVIPSGPLYSGTRKQNIDLMNALSIKPGWSKNEKWPDGTDVDDYSIVDWLKYGMGINSGIAIDASKEARTYLYNKYVKSN